MNLYNILELIVEQIGQKENTNVEKVQDEKDVKTIQDFVEKYQILDNIKNFSVAFGYSKLGLETETLETVSLDDLSRNEELQKDLQIEGSTIQITNNSVLKILQYISNKMKNAINKKVIVEGSTLPFIIIISWDYAGSSYIISSNYQNKKLTIYEYTINKGKHQVEKINRFISKRGVIKNSPYRLLGSILVYHDWFYGWDIKTFENDIEKRKMKNE